MKLLAIVEAPDHVCCRYRIKAFEPALAAAGWSLELLGLARGTLARARQFSHVSDFDSVILQRRLLPAWQLRWLRKKARHLVFDFDDAVLYRDSYDPRGPYSPRRSRRFAATVRLADVITAGNDFLADCALRAGARPDRVRVIPTCVDTDRYNSAPARRQPDADTFDLVWIGSSSTLQGLERQRALWDRLAESAPGVRMRVICDRFPDLGALPVLEVPWSEATEANALAAGDIGVTWVPDDLWSHGKCGLKVLQYQAAGLPVLANPVGVHEQMIEPGVSGWLPRSTSQWIEAVRDLASDPQRVDRMGSAARKFVETHYSVQAWASTFVASIGSHRGTSARVMGLAPADHLASHQSRLPVSTAEARG
jgi:glycosyltransferase involved in cell wall biosynthesis